MKPDLDNQHCRVLLVDDAPENLRILSESLRDDYTIMFAKNGRTPCAWPAVSRRTSSCWT